MKYNTLKCTGVLIALTCIVFFTSCSKVRNTSANDADTEMASDNALGEFVYNDAGNIADDASTKNSGDNLGSYKTSSACATVTKDTLSNPRTITVDFGTTNCLCNDGRNRRGQILISYTGHYRDSGSVHTITFNNFYVNDNHVMGTKSITNMGHNTANHSYFNIAVNGMIVRANTGDSVIWNSNRVRTWTQGESTPTWTDDVYEITGSGSGQRANGIAYTMNITQALVKELSCNWISAGKVELQPSGKPLRTIDFGNGNCDNMATVLINGNTHTITLH